MSWTLDKILKGARRCGASDIHLIRGISPAFRVNGDVRLLEGDALEEEFLRGMHRRAPEREAARDLREGLAALLLAPLAGRRPLPRSVYLHAGVPEMAIRLCELAIRPRGELGLPPIVDELARLPNGLILVTGRDRQREDDHAELHRRPHQPPAPGQDRDHRGPGRVRPSTTRAASSCSRRSSPTRRHSGRR